MTFDSDFWASSTISMLYRSMRFNRFIANGTVVERFLRQRKIDTVN